MRRWTPEELETLDGAVRSWKEGPYAALPSGWSVVAHRVNSRHSTSRSARSCEARWEREKMNAIGAEMIKNKLLKALEQGGTQ